MSESAAELQVCPACRARNLGDARFCSQCGIRLETGSEEGDNERSSVAGADSMVSLVGAATLAGDTPSDDETHLADPLIGVVIADRYRIIEPLGRGGMGVVYKVEHARIGKLMALKILTGELGRNTELVARFKREALMASKLSHPNTVQVFDFGSSEGMTYLAMELLRGSDLGRIVRRSGPLGPARTSRIVIQICSSLAEAHDHDIVHRDLKPENIIIIKGQAGDDVVKVLDFGLAKLRESKELGEVTTRGAIVGTPFYMSPEQIRGEAVDPRSDVYSLGALMYVCLTGQPVFDSATPMGILTKHLTEEPEAPSRRFPDLRIPGALSAIVMRALEKDAERRFQSVRDLQQALVDELRGAGQSSVDLLLDSKQMRELAAADREAVTRGEVERYEKKLKRRGQYATASFGLVLVALAFGGYKLWTTASRSRDFNGSEVEPNNSPGTATPLPFGSEVRGQIGRRLDPQDSDRDFYSVTVPPGTKAVRLTTTALPNMALCTYVYRVGLQSPLGRYCPGAPGRGLVVKALDLEPGDYLLGVMQDRERYTADPAPPVLENISDVYRLKLSAAKPGQDQEVEPNDSRRDANTVARGQAFHGQIAWMHDVDVVCAPPGSGKVCFVVKDAATRPDLAVLQVTPIGGPDDGIPVRVHAGGSFQASPRDVKSPWKSAEVPLGSAPDSACVKLELVPNPWAPTPHPRVAPAGDQEYVVRAE